MPAMAWRLLLIRRRPAWRDRGIPRRDPNRSDAQVDVHYRLAAALERTGDQVGEIEELREAVRIERLLTNPVSEVSSERNDVTFDDDCGSRRVVCRFSSYGVGRSFEIRYCEHYGYDVIMVAGMPQVDRRLAGRDRRVPRGDPPQSRIGD